MRSPWCLLFLCCPLSLSDTKRACDSPASPAVPVVKATWEKDAALLEYYSDVADSAIPTIHLGVPNTERGEVLSVTLTRFEDRLRFTLFSFKK